VLKLEETSGWGEVETIEVGRSERWVVGLTLAEGKDLLGELGRLVLQTQMEEFITCARVCRNCMELRRRRHNRTRKIQTLFGTITVHLGRAPSGSLIASVKRHVRGAEKSWSG
jgi:hypothetical protein